MKSIVEFPNKKSEILRGILYTPDEIDNSRKDIAIFPLSGLMGAEGDYRNHYRIAEYMVKKGYYVLRFSPSGIGLSDGFINDCKVKNLFASIETGLFVDDIRAAVQFISSYDNFTSITLIGICGGAISSQLAAACIDEVEHVIPIGAPVVLDSDDVQYYSSRISDKTSKVILGTYWHKLFSLKAWFRLLTFQSEWDKIFGALINYFNKDLSSLKNDDPASFHYSQYFHDSVNTLLSKRKKILFIFGDSDDFWLEFKNLFLNKYYSDESCLPFDYYLVLNGNHMLSWVEMQMDAAEKICQWLNTQCGKSV